MKSDYLQRFKIILGAIAIFAVIAGAIALAFIIGRDSGSDSGTTEDFVGVGDPAVDEIDPLNDPILGAKSLTSSILSHQPATDNSPADGAARVKDRLTGAYLKLAEDDNVPKPKHWDTWAKDNSQIHTVVELNGEIDVPVDATHAIVPVKAETFVWHADGAQTPIRNMEINVHMVKEAGIWKLSDMEYISVSE